MIKIDRHTVIQVLGSLMLHPQYLSQVDKYIFDNDDFPNTLDKFIYSAINNLYNCGEGARVIRSIDIINVLSQNEIAAELIKKENGKAFLQDCEVSSEPENFNYYYNKLKKLNFLKDLQKTGRDTSNIYCEDLLNPRYTKINDAFERMTLQDLVNRLRLEVSKFEQKYVLNGSIKRGKANDGVEALLKNLQKAPEVGIPLQGDCFNTICRGGRLGKLYIRSSGTGVGKSRRMVGDACYIAYPVRFDVEKNEWVSTGNCEKVLYIMTEQDTSEIQTMILAYLTGYNEDIFKYGTFGENELPRIQKAIEIMNKYQDNFLTAEVPEPCSEVIKSIFRSYAIEQGVSHIFLDYIFSNPAMLNEYRDIGVQPHVALRLFTTTLKNLAKELNIFVMTATQLTLTTEEVQKGGFRDERAIRESKAIIDLADFACIMSRPTTEELNKIEGIISAIGKQPTLVIDVFKNRGGRWNRIRIWCAYDAGNLRTEDLFITTADYKDVSGFETKKFCNANRNKFQKECDELNSTNNGENLIINDYQITNDTVDELIVSAAEAFDDESDKRRRMENVSFNDLLMIGQ